MAIPAEHLYISCTCESGMRNGLRCADCGGRGIVPKGHKFTGGTIPEPAAAEEAAPTREELENLGMPELRERAKALGVSAGGSKAALVDRILEATPEAEEETIPET